MKRKFSMLLMILAVAVLPLCGCGRSYEEYAGRYEMLSAKTDSAVTYDDFSFAEITLSAKGKYTFRYKMTGLKAELMPVEYDCSGTFRLTESELTFSGGAFTVGVMNEKYFSAAFTVGDVTVSGVFALVRPS